MFSQLLVPPRESHAVNLPGIFFNDFYLTGKEQCNGSLPTDDLQRLKRSIQQERTFHKSLRSSHLAGSVLTEASEFLRCPRNVNRRYLLKGKHAGFRISELARPKFRGISRHPSGFPGKRPRNSGSDDVSLDLLPSLLPKPIRPALLAKISTRIIYRPNPLSIPILRGAPSESGSGRHPSATTLPDGCPRRSPPSQGSP